MYKFKKNKLVNVTSKIGSHSCITDKQIFMERGALCDQCPLYSRPAIDSAGNEDSHIVLMGQAPTIADIKTNTLFSGFSGQFLDTLFAYHNLDGTQYRYTNQVLCQKDRGEVPQEAVLCCAPRLQQEIQGKHVVLLDSGLAELTGKSAKDTRGQWTYANDTWWLLTHNPMHVVNYADAALDMRNDFYRLVTGPYDGPPLQYHVLQSLSDVVHVADMCLARPEATIYMDIESCNQDMERSTPEKWYEGYILAIGLKLDTDPCVYIIPENLCQDARVLDVIHPVLSRKNGLVGANFKFDILYFKHYYKGAVDIKIEDDTFLMSYALDERRGVHSLKEHAALFDDKNYDAELEKYVGTGKNVKAYAYIPRDILYEYLAKDVLYTSLAHKHFKTLLKQQNLYVWPYKNVLLRSQQTFVNVERLGLYTYKHKIAEVRQQLEPQFKAVEGQLQALVDNPNFNPGSTKQVAKFLYGRLGMRLPEGYKVKTKSGVSTDDQALTALTDKYTNMPGFTKGIDFISKLQRFRSLQKLLKTYIVKLPLAVDSASWSHYAYILGGTLTGRLSGSIIMTLPASDEFAPLIRGCFGAPDSIEALQDEFFQITRDWLAKQFEIKPLKLSDKGEVLGDFVLVDADFSQAEVRTAGFLSQDKNIIRVYEEDKDIHGEVATQAFGPDWTPDHRRLIKRVVFGSMYNATVETLVAQGVPRDTAQFAFDRFELWANGYNTWRQNQFEIAKTVGELQIPTGRKRRFPIISGSNEWHIRNQTCNAPVQSFANDITLSAFCTIAEYCREHKLPIFPTNYLHDGIYFICYNDEKLVLWFKQFVVETMAKVAHELQIMAVVPQYRGYKAVPFKADVAIKRAWSKTK